MVNHIAAYFPVGARVIPIGPIALVSLREVLMIRLLRLRDWTASGLLILTTGVGVGCSATGGPKFRAAAGARSISSIGDQTLPPAVGANGSQVVADSPTVEPVRDPKARISGRVVDADGYAVAGAVVRLADGGPKAGRDVRVVTDASGAFTLGNLRPGTSYTLVAEADFGDASGVETGRVRADTAETGVQIRLGTSDEAAAVTPRTGKRAAKTRTASERVDGDLKTASPRGVNSEDVNPPADAADVVAASAPRAFKRARAAEADAADQDAPASWHRPGLDSAAKSAPEAAPNPAAGDVDGPLDLDFDAGPGGNRRPTRAIEPDETEDPLPPALPRKSAGVDSDDQPTTRPISHLNRRPRASRVANPAAGQTEPSEPGRLMVGAEALSPAPESAASDALLAMPSATDLAKTPDAAPEVAESRSTPASSDPPSGFPDPNLPVQVAATNPGGSPSGDPVFEPNPGGQSLPVTAPPAAVDPNAPYNPFVLAHAGAPHPAVGSVAALAPASTPTAAPSGTEGDLPTLPARRSGILPGDQATSSSSSSSDVQPPRPKKWGEVATVAAVGSTAATGVAVAADSASRSAPAPPSNRPTAVLTRGSKRVSTRAEAPAFCQFDARANQLLDFQLPDLDGQPVRFRDVEADYILFEFWGTWCSPCTDAIPHLIELQSKYGSSKLKVVGVACEKTTGDKRRAQVASVAEQLGINYPVVLSSMDGNCPVQRAFNVQNYPTSVLVDRRGRVVFRAVGNTESNTFRLEKALANAQKPVQTAHR